MSPTDTISLQDLASLVDMTLNNCLSLRQTSRRWKKADGRDLLGPQETKLLPNHLRVVPAKSIVLIKTTMLAQLLVEDSQFRPYESIASELQPDSLKTSQRRSLRSDPKVKPNNPSQSKGPNPQ